MSDAEKIKKIRELIERWSDQPDPTVPDDEVEAADVLYEIFAMLDNK